MPCAKEASIWPHHLRTSTEAIQQVLMTQAARRLADKMLARQRNVSLEIDHMARNTA